MERERSKKVNNSLHLAFRQISNECIAQGIDMQVIFKNAKLPIPTSLLRIKEDVFKPILKVVCGKEHTSQATTAEISEAWTYMQDFFSRDLGLQIEWPSIETMLKQWEDKK